jgi:hypothetical protein
MGSQPDSLLSLTLDDLQHHVVKYGLDVFPPLDVRTETTRPPDLFRSLHERWPGFYEELSFRPESNDFRILRSYQSQTATANVATFTLTQRGPVFTFPLCLDPLGEFNRDANLDEVFAGSLAETRRHFPGMQILRVGLVRELVFATGQASSIPYLSARFGGFPGAAPAGGNALLLFRDERCNIRVAIETIRIHRQARTPTNQVLEDSSEYGLKVEFDVNNIDMRPQPESDIAVTLERAHSLWPRQLLEFLNSGGGPKP